MTSDLETFESKLDIETFATIYEGLIIATTNLMNKIIDMLKESKVQN